VTLLAGTVTDVAPRLLGSTVTTSIDGATVSVRLTEVEAYGGESDAASHAYRGPTVRNAPMYGPPGTLYVYRSYGVHWCMNVTVGAVGDPAAVLLRAGTVVEGLDVVVERRKRTDHLTDGPGKLCQALGVDGSLTGSSVGVVVRFTPGGSLDAEKIRATPRIGITRAVDRPWRFILTEESRTVTAPFAISLGSGRDPVRAVQGLPSLHDA
jgi:DNA-3-methyladenine glycosylase